MEVLNKEHITRGVISKQQQKSGDILINVRYPDQKFRHGFVSVDFGKTDSERKECLANAEFIKDCFNVLNESGKTARELLYELTQAENNGFNRGIAYQKQLTQKY